jgi:DNA topoisomerase III
MRYKTLILCEKPSVAREVAAALGSQSAGPDWISGSDFAVTWCFGHLLEAVEPHDYDATWQTWNMDTLPMIPPSFNFRYKPRSKDAYRRLKIIRDLAKQSEILVNACDAGREGELIFREVIDFINFPANRTERLWLNTTTSAGILAAWKAKLSSSTPKYVNLGNAARARAQADWILGTNGTRAVTLAFPRGKVRFWSVGRVQTAVLSLVVDRDTRIATFIPEPYYGVKVKLVGTQFGQFIDAKLLVPDGMQKMGKFTKLFKNSEEAARVKSRAMFTIGTSWKVAQTKKDEKLNPPPLFSLVELQKYCSIHLHWSAQHTLDVAQAAYEGRILTYPRTDSSVLPEDYVNEADKAYRLIWPALLSGTSLKPFFPNDHAPAKSVFNNAKLTDHFAIVPTDHLPTLTPNAKEPDHVILWRIVAQRFVLAFCPPAAIVEVQWLISNEDTTWDEPCLVKISGVASRRHLTSPGWVDYAKPLHQRAFEEEPERRPPPPTEISGICKQVEQYTDFSERPDAYREDTLLSAMETHKLGTSATRASTIETLLSRGYIARKGMFVSTEPGKFLITELRVRKLEFLAQPEMTQQWEDQLEQIEQGGDTAPSREQFLGSIREKTETIVRTLGGAKAELRIQVLCPKTSLPVQQGTTHYIFPGYKEIKCPRIILGRTMLAHEYRDVLRSSEGAGPFNGFVSTRTGKSFRAKLVLNEKAQRLEFKFQ